jgi:hypothetical protein
MIDNNAATALPRIMPRNFLFVIAFWILSTIPSAANQPPLAPTWIEPDSGAVLSAVDPHFNLHPFQDPDPGDLALSSDFEVWDDSLNVRAWADLDETGSVSHVHVGDGEFEGPLFGETRFGANRPYRIRARYRDASGAPNATGPWSAWVPFRTASLVTTFPLKLDDIRDDPDLFWGNETGNPIDMPSGLVSSTLEIRGQHGRLLTLTGSPSNSYLKDNPPPLMLEGFVELRFKSGSQGWTQPRTRLKFNDQNLQLQTVYIPEIDLVAGDSLRLWVNEYGATYYAAWSDPAPQFTQLARDVPVPWIAARGGIAVERVVSGLHLPINLAFLPDPGPDSLDAYFYVTELYGKVKVITRNFSVITIMTGLLNFPPTGQFAGSGEMGVTGIAYYAPERALYISHVYHEDDAFWGRVIRAWLSPDRKSVTSIDVVFEYIPCAYSHQVHAVTIAPDGNLFVNTGDGLVSQYAQLMGDLRGKILRMTRNGAVPPDNPTPGSYVYARGFRNPFGAAIRPSTNQLYISDNGANRDDRIVKVAPGSNYGWCCNMAIGATKLFNPTVAPTAILFPPDGILSPDLDGRLFMTLSGPTYDSGPWSDRGKQIWSFALDDTGAIVSTEPLVRYIGSGYGTCVGLGAGPDGLYFTDLYGEEGFNQFGITNANIYRVVPSTVVGVPETPPAAGSRFHLAAAPNPTERRATLFFEMTSPGHGDIRIFDTQGRLRRTFAPRDWPAGKGRVEWDGRDDAGRPVASGLYFVRLAVGGESETTRVVVAR